MFLDNPVIVSSQALIVPGQQLSEGKAAHTTSLKIVSKISAK